MSLLQGVELYSTSVTPNNPNLQFDAQVTSTLQAKYDAGYDRASILYGSIINPDLSRLDTQKAKDEYLKMVDRDLKRVGAIDWSVSENIKTAESLFKGLWSNDLLKKDAIWTKNYMSEMNKAEGFKNCLDPEKCGGQYWDEGVKYMNYKRQEFINADSNTALGFENASYVPYNNVMNDAIAKLKAADLSVKYDKVESGYIVTTKNGEKLRSPLTLLFNETIGKDPKFIEMFKVKSYVDRKDWVGSKLQTGEYANESEANLNYLNAVNNRTINILNEQAYALGVDQGYLDQSVSDLRMKLETGVFAEGSEMHKKLIQLESLKANADNALSFVSQLQKISQNKNKAALNVMVEAVDNENAFNYFNDEISQAVNTLMYKGYEETIKEADPYSKAEFDFNLDLKKIAVQHANSVSLEKLKYQNQRELEEYKAQQKSIPSSDKMNKLDQAIQKVKVFDLKDETAIEKAFRQKFPNASDNEIEAFLQGNSTQVSHSAYGKELDLIRRNAKALLKADANKAATDVGQSPVYPEALMLNEINTISEEEYFDAINKTVNYLNINYDGDYTDLYRKVTDEFLKPKKSTKLLSEVVYDVINNK
jgi:hypothetical protein